MKNNRFPAACLACIAAVFVWSAIRPFDRFTWWLEIAPILLIVPLLMMTYARFRLSNLLYGLIALHAVILMVGGHYTYALVPLFDWIRDVLHQTRNSFDGVGHFAQGFVPAIAARELLLRTSPMQRGKWLGAVIVLSCLGISAVYEIVEYIAAVLTGDHADAFLGTQGDPWDTQKDMALAGIGALLAVLFVGKLHDRSLSRLSLSHPKGNTP